jgi:transcriptional regulator with XRE-family HTH domain
VGDTREQLDGIGDRLRVERVKAGLSQRELARRLGVSASLVSQLESGQSYPSVGTLYSLVNELDLSIDRLVRGSDHVLRGCSPWQRGDDERPPLHPGKRKAIELDSGVRWELLTPGNREGVNFLLAVYEVGGASTPDETLMRHKGREYGYVISGTLSVQVGFEEYQLNLGDAISFDSTAPHRCFNKGSEPVNALWIVVGRGTDR